MLCAPQCRTCPDICERRAPQCRTLSPIFGVRRAPMSHVLPLLLESLIGLYSAVPLRLLREWKAYCNSGKDWVGTGRIADQFRQYRSFKDARAFVRGLGLKSRDGWREYCKSGSKPADIPASPNNTYAEAGWIGMGDWLGTIGRRDA